MSEETGPMGPFGGVLRPGKLRSNLQMPEANFMREIGSCSSLDEDGVYREQIRNK